MATNDLPIVDENNLNHQHMTCGEEALYNLLFSKEEAILKSSSLNKQYLSGDQFSETFTLNRNRYIGNSINLNNESKQKTLDESFSYLQELNAYHIDRLQLEPVVLLDKKQNILEEIQNLAFSNYKTFIRTAQCSREIYSDFSIIECKLDTLITKLPEFNSKCDNFTKIIQNISTSRRTNNLTLQKHNQLLEILEISQLMDTCVRNEYYEEALELAAYVKRLEKKFATTIPLVKQIVNDVNNSLNLMLKQLLNQLKTNLQFNQCLKIIGIIRRLDVFTESELRVKFLQLRDSWLQSILQNIPRTDPYHHISKTIEENRIHLFDIITQYRAIFSDEDNSSTIYLFNSRDSNESKLFYCWLQQKIKIFLNILRKDLNLGVGNKLDSVLSQAMYFGLAFSRVGLDFRALMVPLFEDAILDQLRKSFELANKKFEESLIKLNWSELYSETSYKSSINTKSDFFNINSKSLNFDKNSSIVNPPISLLEFQPLAIYLNCLLQCFNEFRLCAPLSIFNKFTILIKTSLKNLSLFIEQYYKKEKMNFDANENELFKSFLYKLTYELMPFLENCLCVIFPLDQLKKMYNLPPIDVESLKSCFNLNKNLILKDIIDLIPPKINIEESNSNLSIESETLTESNNEIITEKSKDIDSKINTTAAFEKDVKQEEETNSNNVNLEINQISDNLDIDN